MLENYYKLNYYKLDNITLYMLITLEKGLQFFLENMGKVIYGYASRAIDSDAPSIVLIADKETHKIDKEKWAYNFLNNSNYSLFKEYLLSIEYVYCNHKTFFYIRCNGVCNKQTLLNSVRTELFPHIDSYFI